MSTDLIDNVDLPVVVVDCDTTVTRFNPAAATLLSLTTADVGRSLRDLRLPVRVVMDLDELCEDAIIGGVASQRDMRVRDGLWFVVRTVPLMGSGGQRAGAVLTLTNVTALRASVEQAIHEREYTKAILNTIVEPLVVLDADLRVQTANRAFYTMFQVSRDETQGVLLGDLGNAQWDIAGLRARLHETLATDNRPFEGFEVEREFPGIGRRTVRLNARRLSRNGTKTIVLTIEDVTERRQAEETRARLAAIVDSSGDAIVGKTLDGVIVSWNRAAERIFGYTAAEAVGQQIVLIVPSDRRDEEDEVMVRLRRGEGVDHFQTIRQTKDGRRINVSLTVSPIRNAEGRIIGVSKIARDITDRLRAEDAVRQRTAQFETLLNEAPLGVYLVDAELRLRHVNPTALPVFGDIPDLIGRDFREVVHILWPTAYADEIVAQFRHTLDTGEPYLVPERSEERRDRGVREVYEWQINRLPLPDGRHGVVCYFRDISVQVQTRETLKEADRRKDDFLATLSHELRTPLAAMLGWTRMLRTGRLDTTQIAHALEVIERNTVAQARLVNDLLDVSRVVTGKLRLDLRTVDLTTVIDSALGTVEHQARDAGVRLTRVIDPAAGPVWGDYARLEQAVVNLVSNAIKFTPAGGSVTVRLARMDPHVCVTVHDTGAGIAAEFLPYVFDPFRQADATSRRSHGGLGLGLAIVRNVVELHKGTVTAESAGAGRGSTFTVTLPLMAVRLDGERLDRRSDDAASAPARDERGSLAGVRVLLVDDDPDARDLLVLTLAHHGATVEALGSVTEALGAHQRAEADILISDIGMPGQNGYDLIRAIRTREGQGQPRLPAVALSAYAAKDDRDLALAEGFEAYLAKPVEPDALIETISRLAKHSSRS